MVLAQLLVPLLSLFGKDGTAIFQGRLGFYEETFAEGLSEVDAACERAEELLEQMALAEIKSRINQVALQGEEELNIPKEEAVVSGEIIIDRIEVEIGAGEGEAMDEE